MRALLAIITVVVCLGCEDTIIYNSVNLGDGASAHDINKNPELLCPVPRLIQ